MNTFTAVPADTFTNEMIDMGFVERAMDRVKEVVFSRDIPNTNFAVVIFSTLENNEMRDSGSDAIKVTLWNNKKDRPISSESRINRVGNVADIMTRVRDRARKVWGLAKHVHHCDRCSDGVMVLRKPKGNAKWKAFKGCSNFPTCKNAER
tara:strand:- start:376 stop:825 length:450 start_codon:yes stop_codon:yes gene_type:complete